MQEAKIERYLCHMQRPMAFLGVEDKRGFPSANAYLNPLANTLSDPKKAVLSSDLKNDPYFASLAMPPWIAV